MKKILFLLAIIAAAGQVKAQQLQTNDFFKHSDTTQFKLKTDSNWLLHQKFNFQSPALNGNQSLPVQLAPITSGIRYYTNIPVLRPNMNAFKMPVVKTDKPGELYPMSVKGYNIIRPESETTLTVIP